MVFDVSFPRERSTSLQGRREFIVYAVIGQEKMLGLSSSRQKDRLAAAVHLRETFAGGQSPIDWTQVLPAVFDLVVVEKSTHLTKPSQKQISVLSSLSLDVRNYVSHALPISPDTLLRPTIQHFLQVLPHKNSVFQPIALNYAKSLVFIFNERVFATHLSYAQWKQLVSLASSVIQQSTNQSAKELSLAEITEFSRLLDRLMDACPRSLLETVELLAPLLTDSLLFQSRELDSTSFLASSLFKLFHHVCLDETDTILSSLSSLSDTLHRYLQSKSTSLKISSASLLRLYASLQLKRNPSIDVQGPSLDTLLETIPIRVLVPVEADHVIIREKDRASVLVAFYIADLLTIEYRKRAIRSDSIDTRATKKIRKSCIFSYLEEAIRSGNALMIVSFVLALSRHQRIFQNATSILFRVLQESPDNVASNALPHLLNLTRLVAVVNPSALDSIGEEYFHLARKLVDYSPGHAVAAYTISSLITRNLVSNSLITSYLDDIVTQSKFLGDVAKIIDYFRIILACWRYYVSRDRYAANHIGYVHFLWNYIVNFSDLLETNGLSLEFVGILSDFLFSDDLAEPRDEFSFLLNPIWTSTHRISVIESDLLSPLRVIPAITPESLARLLDKMVGVPDSRLVCTCAISILHYLSEGSGFPRTILENHQARQILTEKVGWAIYPFRTCRSLMLGINSLSLHHGLESIMIIDLSCCLQISDDVYYLMTLAKINSTSSLILEKTSEYFMSPVLIKEDADLLIALLQSLLPLPEEFVMTLLGNLENLVFDYEFEKDDSICSFLFKTAAAIATMLSPRFAPFFDKIFSFISGKLRQKPLGLTIGKSFAAFLERALAVQPQNQDCISFLCQLLCAESVIIRICAKDSIMRALKGLDLSQIREVFNLLDTEIEFLEFETQVLLYEEIAIAFPEEGLRVISSVLKKTSAKLLDDFWARFVERISLSGDSEAAKLEIIEILRFRMSDNYFPRTASSICAVDDGRMTDPFGDFRDLFSETPRGLAYNLLASIEKKSGLDAAFARQLRSLASNGKHGLYEFLFWIISCVSTGIEHIQLPQKNTATVTAALKWSFKELKRSKTDNLELAIVLYLRLRLTSSITYWGRLLSVVVMRSLISMMPSLLEDMKGFRSVLLSIRDFASAGNDKKLVLDFQSFIADYVQRKYLYLQRVQIEVLRNAFRAPQESSEQCNGVAFTMESYFSCDKIVEFFEKADLKWFTTEEEVRFVAQIACKAIQILPKDRFIGIHEAKMSPWISYLEGKLPKDSSDRMIIQKYLGDLLNSYGVTIEGSNQDTFSGESACSVFRSILEKALFEIDAQCDLLILEYCHSSNLSSEKSWSTRMFDGTSQPGSVEHFTRRVLMHVLHSEWAKDCLDDLLPLIKYPRLFRSCLGYLVFRVLKDDVTRKSVECGQSVSLLINEALVSSNDLKQECVNFVVQLLGFLSTDPEVNSTDFSLDVDLLGLCSAAQRLGLSNSALYFLEKYTGSLSLGSTGQESDVPSLALDIYKSLDNFDAAKVAHQVLIMSRPCLDMDHISTGAVLENQWMNVLSLEDKSISSHSSRLEPLKTVNSVEHSIKKQGLLGLSSVLSASSASDFSVQVQAEINRLFPSKWLHLDFSEFQSASNAHLEFLLENREELSEKMMHVSIGSSLIPSGDNLRLLYFCSKLNRKYSAPEIRFKDQLDSLLWEARIAISFGHSLANVIRVARKQRLFPFIWSLKAEIAEEKKLAFPEHYQFVKTLWDMGMYQPAINEVEKLYSIGELQSCDTNRLALRLSRWKSSMKLSSHADVVQKLIRPVIKDCIRNENKKMLAKAQKILSEYSLLELRKIEDDQSIETMTEMIEKTRKNLDTPSLDEAIKISLKRQLFADTRALTDLKGQRRLLLRDSFMGMIQALRYSNSYDILAFQLINLLFEYEKDPVLSEIDTYFDSVPSYKLVSLSHQLSVRLSDEETLFQKILKSILRRLNSQHPYHSIGHVIFLRNNTGTANSRARIVANAADRYLNSLRSSNPAVESIILNMQEFYVSCVQFASSSSKAISKPQDCIKISTKLKIRNLESGKYFVITNRLSVNEAGFYDNVPLIDRFAEHYRLVGGINKPKLIECYDNHGKRHRMLFKSKDDLRQDAVLMNVFDIFNAILAKENVSEKQQVLGMRTYKVIPLSCDTGLIEWIDNTMALGDYVNRSHAKYYSNELSASECRALVTREFNRKDSSRESKLEVFQSVLKRFSPVLRKFFLERFADPREWIQKRDCFVKSVALTSILGYFVGLGDRHSHNILLDARTGEVIHIDLGIAFEQGKLLTIPEIVPFRLTQNIVDGFGLEGINGSFRSNCCKAMQLMRRKSEVFMTIFDVFKYDPLYKWAKADGYSMRQLELSKKINEDAVAEDNNEVKRALMQIRNKLKDSRSVECHVNELLAEATSQANLSRMFYGWAPWI